MSPNFHPRTERLLATVGPNLRVWRKAQGLTATQVADRAGISRPTLRVIETEPERASFGNLLAVASVLGLDDALVASLDPVESARGKALLKSLADTRE
ncbi:helix-turn-helix domain-containing protein [Buchananella felis]|uniref:helix-turn-helix domain-containing protein n=1 Tax=Buchananella felis TaxID=3231492 RepID=UPI003526CABE